MFVEIEFQAVLFPNVILCVFPLKIGAVDDKINDDDDDGTQV